MRYLQLTGDTLLLKDTIRLNNEMLLVSKTYKITDTISRPVIVNGQWLTKRITVTDYVALPSDTIWLTSKKVITSTSNQIKSVAEKSEVQKPDYSVKETSLKEKPAKEIEIAKLQTNKKPPKEEAAITDISNEAISLKKVPVAQKQEQHPKIEPLQTPIALQDSLKKEPVAKAEPTIDLPVLKPTAQTTSKDKAKKNEVQKAKIEQPKPTKETVEATTPSTNSVQTNVVVEEVPKPIITPKENIVKPDIADSKTVIEKPISEKKTVSAKPTETIVKMPTRNINLITKNMAQSQNQEKEDDGLQNVYIEVFDERRVVGLRTDLPDDDLPPGGTVLVKVVQPVEVAPIQVQQQSSGNAPINIPPFAPPLPANATTSSTANSVKQSSSMPEQSMPSANRDDIDTVLNNENITPQRTPSPERILIESKPITMSEAYQLTLSDIQKQRKEFAKQYKKAKTEEEANDVLLLAGRYLEEVISNDIVYYWYGTGFDKEGMSSSPGSGRIACSYFVVTMLTEAGLNIDRVKLAQQSALNIVKTLSTPELVTHCSAPDEVEALLLQKGAGLYFIGFSYHVGFLYYDGKEMHLIHASPLPPGTVSRISMKGARSFEYSNFYDIGKLTENKSLIINWLTGGKVQILP